MDNGIKARCEMEQNKPLKLNEAQNSRQIFQSQSGHAGSWTVVDSSEIDEMDNACHRYYGRVRTPVAGFPALRVIRGS